MTEPYLSVDYLYMTISYILTTIAIVRAGIQDHENIFSNQTPNYLLLSIALTIMFTEYITHPELAITNMIILAVYSTIISVYTSMTTRRIFGNNDIIFTQMYIFSTPPIIINNIIIPYTAIVVFTSTLISIYKIYYKKQIGVPFLTIMLYTHMTLLPIFSYSIATNI